MRWLDKIQQTLVWRSLVEVRFGGGFLDESAPEAEIWRVETDDVVDRGVLLGFV